MSSTSFPASAAFPSDLNEPACVPSRSARSSHSAAPSSGNTGLASHVSTISEPSQPIACDQVEFPWVLSAEASPARISVLREKALALRERVAAYGKNTPDLLANFDPATSSWRTSQRCLVEGWTEFSGTWPRSGTMRSGTVFQLQPLAPLTDETGSGLLPTLTARDFKSDSCSPAFRAKRDAMTMGKTLPWVLGGLLNPTWCEWFMGFPAGWTALERSEMPLSLKYPKSSGEQS
jgi:hypothetical protein